MSEFHGYHLLTDADTAAIAQQRVRDLEGEHFRLRLILAEGPATSQAAAELSGQIVDLERRILVHTTPADQQHGHGHDQGEGGAAPAPLDGPPAEQPSVTGDEPGGPEQPDDAPVVDQGIPDHNTNGAAAVPVGDHAKE